jgi:hypothetical protein
MSIAILFALILTASASAESNKSLSDYFLEIPSVYLEFVDDDTGKVIEGKDREKLITLKDDSHGYIEAGGDKTVAIQQYSIALFSRDQRGPLIAVANNQGKLLFLEISGQKKNWKDVTKDVFPKIKNDFLVKMYHLSVPEIKNLTTESISHWSSPAVIYKLPRTGTTISAQVGIDHKAFGKELFKLQFINKKKFVIEAPRP